MGILDFLKKIFNEPEKTESTIGKIAFSEIEDFIKKKINETNAKENETISLIKHKITLFTSELKEKIKIVEGVDIEAKEKNDRVKSATNEGRRKYMESLERFIETLEAINQTSLEKVTAEINSDFLRFNENSKMSYERATILIGKEMGNIREILKNLSKELITIFNENKEIMLISKRFSLIKSKYNEILEIKEKLIKIKEEIINITNKILKKEKESKEILKNIDKIRNSSEYLENIEKEKDMQIKEKEVEKEISELRQLLDFKALSNFFHILEDKMTIVKLYRDDFTGEFKKDRGNRLLNLLNESKLNSEKLYDKIKQIQDKEEEIENSKKEIKKDQTQALSSELEKINTDIKDLEEEKRLEEKKKEKLKITKEEALKLIREELNTMNMELEDED